MLWLYISPSDPGHVLLLCRPDLPSKGVMLDLQGCRRGRKDVWEFDHGLDQSHIFRATTLNNKVYSLISTEMSLVSLSISCEIRQEIQ